MMKYLACGYLTISVMAEIEAESEKEAREKASILGAPGLCHQCDHAGDGIDTWKLNGFDDPPNDAIQYVEEIS